MPMGRLGHLHDGAQLCTPLPINKSWIFIYCLCVALDLFMCLLICHMMSFYLLMCLGECWLITWLPLVGYACFVLARCYVITPLYRNAYGMAN